MAMKSSTHCSANEMGQEELVIERDSTLMESLIHLFRYRKWSTEHTDVWIKKLFDDYPGGSLWVSKTTDTPSLTQFTLDEIASNATAHTQVMTDTVADYNDHISKEYIEYSIWLKDFDKQNSGRPF